LQPAERRVAVQADDEDVAERARPLEELDVPDVKQIEAAVREDHGLAGAAKLLANRRDLLARANALAVAYFFVPRLRHAELHSSIVVSLRGFQTIFRRTGGAIVGMWAPA